MSSENTQNVRSQFSIVLQGAASLQSDGSRYCEAEQSTNDQHIVDIDSRLNATNVPITERGHGASCMVKLFDRCVDLIHYESKTPIYVMCRDWISDGTVSYQGAKGKPTDESSIVLPKPRLSIEPQKCPMRESGNLAKRCNYLDNILSGVDKKSQHQNFTQMKMKWIETRRQWQLNNSRNESRYRQSRNYLRRMLYDSNSSAFL